VAEFAFCPRCGERLETRLLKVGEPTRLVCVACEFVFYQDPRLAAGAILQTERGVLLLQRGIEPRRGSWVFPGGYVDRGESPEAAAVREAREEAGVEIALESLLGVYHAPAGSPVVLIVYRAVCLSGTPQPLDETLAVGEFSLGEIPWDDLGFPTTRAALRDYVAGR